MQKPFQFVRALECSHRNLSRDVKGSGENQRDWFYKQQTEYL